MKPLAMPTLVKEEAPEPMRVEDDSEATDIEDENTDAGDFAVEMGLACVQCKQIEQTPNNQLVECQECHNLYHQECHKPPLVDQDVLDPRFVWYCSKCQKTMKKIAVKPNKNKSPVHTPAAVVSALPAKEVVSAGLKMTGKSDSSLDSRPILPFRREPKVSVVGSMGATTSSTPSAKPIGLAALANISRSKNPGEAMASAEKRLQSLKKNKNKLK